MPTAIDALDNDNKTVIEQMVNGVNFFSVKAARFGAVGDGATNDRAAINACFTAALAALPAVVYFPPGDYNIEDGVTVAMTQGTGGLTVQGAGHGVSKITMTGASSYTNLFALRIYPSGSPTPGTYTEYIHDITIKDLACYDDDPTTHAAGDQTHGFNITYCINAEISGCHVENVGDEGINTGYLRGARISHNKLINCPAEGTDGSAITVQHGSADIDILGNIIWGSNTFGTRSTVASSSSKGIALEIVNAYDLESIHIQGNSIRDCGNRGVGISTNAAVEAKNIEISANTFDNCGVGIGKTGGGGDLKGLVVMGNSFEGCTEALDFDAGKTTTFNLTINGNYIHDCTTAGMFNATGVVTNGNLISECDRGWRVFNGEDIHFNGDKFTGVGGSSLEPIEVETGINTSAVGCVTVNTESNSAVFKGLDEVKDCIIERDSATSPENALFGCGNVIGCTINGGIVPDSTRVGGIISNNHITWTDTGGANSFEAIAIGASNDDWLINGNYIDLSASTNNQRCIDIATGATGTLLTGNILKSKTAGLANAFNDNGTGTVADFTNNNIST